MDAIYLDNAATSFPKPPGVSDRMKEYLDQVGANVGRASYGAAQQAGLVTLSLRERLCRLLHFDAPSHVVLTAGATAGLNLVLKGFLRPGDHCLVSSMEHNAVMRPLNQLARAGVTFDRIPCDRSCAPTPGWWCWPMPPTSAARCRTQPRWAGCAPSGGFPWCWTGPRPPGITPSTTKRFPFPPWLSQGTRGCWAPPESVQCCSLPPLPRSWNP